MGLCTAIALILVAFAFFREDKEEQITPLCPQLVVREPELGITFPWDAEHPDFDIKDAKGKIRAKVVFDWTDPFRTSTRGVAATVRLLSDQDVTLATVVARHMASHGQGLALCRGQCEIFGFVEPSEQYPKREYTVRHRSGVHLLTLGGQFSVLNVDGTNAAGTRVCSFGRREEGMHGRVTQHVDIGLVICSLLAAYVHRKLTAAPPLECAPPSGPPASGSAVQMTKGEAAAGDLLIRKQNEALEGAPEAMLTASGLAPICKGETLHDREDAPGASSDLAGKTAVAPTTAAPTAAATTWQAERQENPFWGAEPYQQTKSS